jgi:hypothetical protein
MSKTENGGSIASLESKYAPGIPLEKRERFSEVAAGVRRNLRTGAQGLTRPTCHVTKLVQHFDRVTLAHRALHHDGSIDTSHPLVCLRDLPQEVQV